MRTTFWSTAVKQLSLAALSLLVVARVRAAAAPTASIPEVRFEDRAVDLADWLVVGPLDGDKAHDGWEADLWSRFGAPEAQITPASFSAVASTLPAGVQLADPHGARWVRTAGAKIADLNYLYSRPYGNEPPFGAYAICRVTTERAQDAWLLVGSGGGTKIWLNGAVVDQCREMRVLMTYSDGVAVHLRAGENTLLVKVGRNGDGMCGFTLRLEPTPEAALETALESQHMDEAILVSSAIIRDQTLDLAIRGGPADARFAAELQDGAGRTVWQERNAHQGRCAVSPALESGLYELVVAVKGKRFQEPVCFGDPAALLAALASGTRRDRRTEDDIAGLSTLLTQLCRSPLARERHAPDKVESWSRLLVHHLRDWQRMGGSDSPAGRKRWPGLHLWTFRSAIDGQLISYQVALPDVPPPAGMPLVFMATPVVKATRGFATGPMITAVGAFDDAEQLADAASQCHAAVVWPGYRNLPGGYECEFTHYDEVLADLAARVQIDRSRVYLMGACGSGWQGALAAAHWPARFAAAGFLHPVFNGPPTGRSEVDRTVYFPNRKEAFEQLAALRDVPFNLVYDGSSPGHGDWADIVDFKARAEPVGVSVTCSRVPQAADGETGGYQALLTWLLGHRRPGAATTWSAHYAPDFVHRGSLSAAVARPFVVVRGTGGSAAEQKTIEAMVANFDAEWTKVQFGHCRVVTDRELSPADERAFSLVLVGNAETNSAWRRLAVNTPVRVEADGIGYGSGRWSGANLAIEALVVFPSDASRALVFIGANNLQTVPVLPWDLTRQGFFKVGIWSGPEGDLVHLESDFK